MTSVRSCEIKPGFAVLGEVYFLASLEKAAFDESIPRIPGSSTNFAREAATCDRFLVDVKCTPKRI
eukprot:6178201-Amphidinium_carterae.2